MLEQNVSIGAYDLKDPERLCALIVAEVHNNPADLAGDYKMVKEEFPTSASVIPRVSNYIIY